MPRRAKPHWSGLREGDRLTDSRDAHPSAMDYHLAHEMQCAFPAGSVEDMKHDVTDEP
jgi:hypothetical protein